MKPPSEELRRIREILKQIPQGMSVTEIARALGKNKHSVGRYLDILRVSGYVEMRNYGMAKVFTLSQRIPLSALLSFPSEMIMVLDLEHRIAHINDQFLQFLGMEREEAVGRQLEYLPVPDPMIHDLVLRLLAALNGEEVAEELEIQTEPARTFRQKAVPTVFDNGTQGMTVILEEITAQKQAEQALKESEALFRGMAENIQDGLVISRDKEMVYVNERAAAILGYPRDEIFAMTPLDVTAPEEQERVRALVDEYTISGGVPRELRFWIVQKSGKRRYLSARLSSIDHEGSHIAYIVLTDMTEWKEAEETLKRQYLFVHHFIDAFPRPIYCLDPGRRFLECNQAFEEMVGRSRAAIIGARTVDVFPAEDRAVYEQGDDLLFLEPSTCTYEATLQFADGSIRQVTIEKATLRSPEEGAPLTLIGNLLERGRQRP
ncbi:PAS domain S-box protein [Methanosphaerula subterraneus]|uniref:PAS domain S-box protein n=1 Tax=Methanosphaerula subterraneus TaxID=3350244 RepID=UPI003F826F93